LDLAISPDPKKAAEKKRALARKEIAGLVSKERKAFNATMDAFAKYKSDKKVSLLREAHANNFAVVVSCITMLETKFVNDSALSKKTSALGANLKTKMNLIKQNHDAVITYFESKDESDEKRIKLTKSLQVFETSLEAIDSMIKTSIAGI
jgi:hypothetical protein